jgi:Flp pilus assembly protein TadB
MQPYDNPRLPGPGGLGGWLQRALLVVVAVSLAIVATFFLTVALIVGAFIALAIGARFWWTLRKLRKQARATEALEGDYSVIERSDTAERLER